MAIKRGQPSTLDHLYQHRRWRRIRQLQLNARPLCAICEVRGVVTPAVVADHAVPHGGDVTKFWTNPLISLCRSCHDSVKRRLELGQRVTWFGLDGLPTVELEPSAEAVRHRQEREARSKIYRKRARG